MGLLKWLFRNSANQRQRDSSLPWNKTVRVADVLEAISKPKAREEIDVLRYLEELPIGKVLKVYDGDTFLASLSGNTVKVRLDSIDCPEDDQPWGSTATAGLIKLIGGKSVRMELHGFDDYGRTLATLYVQNASSGEWTNVNERMIILGHAWVMHMYLDHLPLSRQTKLRRLQDWSRSRRVGLWRTEAPVPPWTWKGAKKDVP